MPEVTRIQTCLWFDGQGEAAARFYTGIFPNSKIHGSPTASSMTVSFELDGQPFVALNGGPHFKFNEAVSLMVMCETQAEVDAYWDKLSAGGDPSAQRCGWLKDKFGLSWQVIPRGMETVMGNPDPQKRERAFAAMMKMKKLDLAELERAAAG
jgi:predicted 3-demethylubiquinone-9 3-methyltransferase (glyoxalase superfamily)